MQHTVSFVKPLANDVKVPRIQGVVSAKNGVGTVVRKLDQAGRSERPPSTKYASSGLAKEPESSK